MINSHEAKAGQGHQRKNFFAWKRGRLSHAQILNNLIRLMMGGPSLSLLAGELSGELAG